MRPSARRHLHAIGRHRDLLDGAAEADGHAAVAHLVDEIVDDLAVDEVEDGVARLDQRHRHVERREDRRIFDADHAAADHRQRARQGLSSRISSLSKMRSASNGTLSGRCGRVPTEISALVEADVADLAGVGGQRGAVGVDELTRGMNALHRIAHELVLQHLDLVVERLVQARDQVLGGDVLLDPVAAAVEAALAPARKIEHGLAQRLGRDGAGVHRNAAEPAALVDHQHRLAELGRLHGGAPARRAAADHQHVVVVHSARTPLAQPAR